MKIKKSSITTLVILLLILAMENFFYLIDTDALSVQGVFNYDLIWLFILLLFMALNSIKYNIFMQKINAHYKLVIGLLLAFVVISAFQCQKLTGQPVEYAFRAQRRYFITLLLYFVIRMLYYKNIIKDDLLEKGLLWLGAFSVLLYLFQVIAGNDFEFIHIHANERYGTLRLYVDSVLCVIIGFIGLNNFLKTKNYIYLFFVALTLIYELFVSKGRLEFLAFSFSMLFGILLMKKYTKTKFVVICVVLIGIMLFLNSQHADYIMKGINAMENQKIQDNTMYGRMIARENYFKQLSQSKQTMVFGCGYPSTLYSIAAKRAGLNDKMPLSDNGISAFIYVYGYGGLAVILLCLAKMLRMAQRLYKEQGEYIYIMYIVFTIALSYNIVFWWTRASWTAVTILLMCQMEHKLYDKNINIT